MSANTQIIHIMAVDLVKLIFCYVKLKIYLLRSVTISMLKYVTCVVKYANEAKR